MNQTPPATKHKALRITAMNHVMIKEYIKPGSEVIDATAGNGHDSIFLLKQIDPGGTLYAFDTQAAALENTKNRIENLILNSDTKFHLINDSHGNIHQYIKGPADAAVFNLGYLPGSDHTVTTTWNELYKALNALTLHLIKPGGIISIISYSGHQGGKEEQEKIFHFLEELPANKFSVHITKKWNAIKSSPVLILIECLKNEL